MNLAIFVKGQRIAVPKQIRVLAAHPVQGPIEGMFEAEGNGHAFIRIPDHLKDQQDYIGLRLRVQFGLDPFAPYMLCSPQSVIFLS